MEPYQQRVVDEKHELDAKIAKLDAFMAGDEWHALSQTQQQLLNRQRAAMVSYADALSERLLTF